MIAARPRVLIVDDDAEIRRIVNTVLRDDNLETEDAANGNEALAAVDRCRPDAIVLDLVLPDIHGLTICKRLKQQHQTQRIPVLILTGLDAAEDMVAGLAEGADDYLTKPFSVSVLKARVMALLRRKRMFDDVQALNDELLGAIAKQGEELAELFALSLQINSAGDLIELLQRCCDSVTQLLAFRRVVILLRNVEGNAFQWRGHDEALALPAIWLDPLLVPRRPLVLTKQKHPVILDWLHGNLEFPPGPVHVMPLAAGAQILGLVLMAGRRQQAMSANESALTSYFVEMASVAIKNRLSQLQIRETQDATIFSLAMLAEYRDQNTGNHLRRVQFYCKLLAEHLRGVAEFEALVTPRFLEDLWRTSPLHDIGKVGVPDRVLLKNGPLTSDEYQLIKTHTIIGAECLRAANNMLRRDAFLEMAERICRWHHERWDGMGYPDQIGGDTIPLEARILSVADVYDALTTARPYKAAFPHAQAADIIRNCAGTQFDPRLITAFETLQTRFDAVRGEFADGT